MGSQKVEHDLASEHGHMLFMNEYLYYMGYVTIHKHDLASEHGHMLFMNEYLYYMGYVTIHNAPYYLENY